jgi:hypothetical protein
MGLGNSILNWCIKNPTTTGKIAFYSSLPYGLLQIEKYCKENQDFSYFDAFKVSAPIPIGAFAVTTSIATLLRVLQIRKKQPECTVRKGDRQIIKTLEDRINQQTPPTIFLKGEKELKHSIWDILRFNYLSGKDQEEKSRKQKNPLIAGGAIMKYCGSEEKADDAFILLKDAFDWLEGKKPQLSFTAKCWSKIEDFAYSAGRKLEPKSIESYINSSAHESLVRPESAWKWSSLGKSVADEFNLPYRVEMYVFHALLATAQKRSDTGEAWKDAFRVLCEKPEWERLSDSRSIVRTLNNSKFFSQTFVFKARESREALVKEAEAGATLAALVEDVEVPQPLYITQETYEGKYVSIMRRIKGETLYDKLKKDDKSAMPQVISTLAKIHVHFPTAQYEKLDIRKNLEDKLSNLQLRTEITDGIMKHYHPVISAIKDTAVWVWNKDAHPENWIIGEKISILDNEGDHLVPAFFDLVNLLEYGDFFGDKEKTSYLIQYITKISQEGKHISIATAMRGYYNCLIHRALALTSAWSAPNRQRMKIYRKQTIRKAIFAIDAIREEDKAYYQRHEGDYVMLRHMLDDLHRLIPS